MSPFVCMVFHKDVPLVEIIHLLVSTDRDLALVGPVVSMGQGSTPQADLELFDAPVEGVYQDDPLPPNPEDDSAKEVEIGGSQPTTKWLIAWIDSPLTEKANVNIVGKILHKRLNEDFLLGESDTVVDIPDDDTPKLSEGRSKEVTELPHEPKEEPEDATDPDDLKALLGRSLRLGFKLLLLFLCLWRRIKLLRVPLLLLWWPLESTSRSGGLLESLFLCNILLHTSGSVMLSLWTQLKIWISFPILTWLTIVSMLRRRSRLI